MSQGQEPQKILIFSLAYYPEFVGGAEVAIKEITDRVSKEDVEFKMITAKMSFSQNRREQVGKVMVYRVGVGIQIIDKFLMPIPALFKAIFLHRKHNFDGIWQMMANQSGVASSFFKVWSRIPMILTLQEGDEEEHLKRYAFSSDFLYKIFIRPWHLLPIKLADTATVISNYLKDRLRGYGFEGKIHLVPNGVDLNKFSREFSGGEVKRVYEYLDLDKDDQVIFTSSRLARKNAIDDLVKSLVDLPSHYKLLIAGDGEERGKIEKLIEENNLDKRVILLGFVPHDEMVKYLKSSDVFCRPSLSEGMGNSFIEAMAAKVPVVATRVGGIKDFLEDEKTGFVVEPKDPEGIARAIKRATTGGMREHVIRDAFEMVKERYSWEKVAKDMRNVFKNI